MKSILFNEHIISIYIPNKNIYKNEYKGYKINKIIKEYI